MTFFFFTKFKKSVFLRGIIDVEPSRIVVESVCDVNNISSGLLSKIEKNYKAVKVHKKEPILNEANF